MGLHRAIRILILIALMVVEAGISRAESPIRRAAYLWNLNGFDSPTTGTRRMLELSARWGISTLWIAVPPAHPTRAQEIFDQPVVLRRTLTQLHRANIRPGLLIGESEWSDPYEAAPMVEALWLVARWNRANPGATFSEVHLDIEPQSRTTFSIDPEGTIRNWRESHKVACDIGDALGIPVSMSIATTATLQVTSTTLAIPARLAGRFSAVSLMAYRRQFLGENGSEVMIAPVMEGWQDNELPPRSIYLGVELTTATASLHHAVLSRSPPLFPHRIPTTLGKGSAVRLTRPGDLWSLSISRPDGRPPATQAEWRNLIDSVGFQPTRDQKTLNEGLLWLRESGESFQVSIVPDDDRTTQAPRLITYRYRMPSSVSFHGQTPTEISAALAVIEERLSPYPSFAGVAIHDFGELNNLTAPIP